MKQIVLISDTHNSLDQRFIKYFKESDEIWHAGDIGSLEITDELKEYSKLRAVFGNIDNKDIRSEFKKTLNFKCEEVKITMTHISKRISFNHLMITLTTRSNYIFIIFIKII